MARAVQTLVGIAFVVASVHASVCTTVNASCLLSLRNDSSAALSLVELPASAPGHDASDVDLLAWATASASAAPLTATLAQSPQLPASTQLLIGVKSAALDGFADRQTIRQTWADAAVRPPGVAVVFLGCAPNWTTQNNQTIAWQRALEHEKRTYDDLLTHELRCEDSYWTLVDKVKGFLHWTTAQGGLAAIAYVMLTDADVYIDLARLTALLFLEDPPVVPRRRFYGGEVIQTQFGTTLHPLRDPRARNYLSTKTYPLGEKPLFATGAHYLLSVDLVRFLARNSDALLGVGTLEDVSVAFWLLALRGIRPVHMPQFDNVRYTLCHNGLIAYADISRLAMHRIHQNMLHSRCLCDGFFPPSWDKRVRDHASPELPQSFLTGGSRVQRPFRYSWDLRINTTSSVLDLVTTIATDDHGTNETAVTVYTPVKESVDGFCHALLEEAQVHMPTTVIPRTFCVELRRFLSDFLSSAATSVPATSHILSLARQNLLEDSVSMAAFVQLVPTVSSSRTLVECLVAAAFTGVHVMVLEAAEHAARFSAFAPDIVFTTAADDGPWNEAVPRRVIAFRDMNHRIPADNITCKFGTESNRIEISSVHVDPPCQSRQLYIPMASQSFARRHAHSPVALLTAITKPLTGTQRNVPILFSCRKRHVVMASAADVLAHHLHDEQFTIDHDLCTTTNLPALDQDVVRFSAYTFVVVVEEWLHVAGHVSDLLVSAFLAGAIPVYYGHSPTVSWLFNPRAFIDCGASTSLQACATHVRRVAKTAALYDIMKNAPPVVNTTAFVEVFSWHPHVITTVGRGLEELFLGPRLATLINNT